MHRIIMCVNSEQRFFSLHLLLSLFVLLFSPQLYSAGSSGGLKRVTPPGPLYERFEETLEAVNSFSHPSLSPLFGRGLHQKTSTAEFQQHLDRLAYQIFFQFPDPQLQTQLWQMYFQPEHFSYADEGDWEADTTVSMQEMAVASYIPLKYGGDHKLVLSPHLKQAPTWSRIYRLVALVQLGHEHQFIAKKGLEADYGYYYGPLKAANLVSSAFVKQLLLSEAPYKTLHQEALKVENLWVAKGLTELLDMSKNLSDKEMWTFFIRPLRYSFGLKDTQITELFNTSLLEFLTQQNRVLSWAEIEAHWLGHHREWLDRQKSSNSESFSFSELKSFHRRDHQQESVDFLMKKTTRQIACQQFLIVGGAH